MAAITDAVGRCDAIIIADHCFAISDTDDTKSMARDIVSIPKRDMSDLAE